MTKETERIRNLIYFKKEEVDEAEKELFFQSHKDELISSLKEETLILLSILSFSGPLTVKDVRSALGKEEIFNLKRLESRLFISVTEDGEIKLRSKEFTFLYPLLGEERENKKALPSSFPLLLLSLVRGRKIKRNGRYFSSDEYLSLIPSMDRNRISNASERAIEALKELSVVKEEDNLIVEGDNYLAFIGFPTLLQFSYIMRPQLSEKERENHLYLLRLVTSSGAVRQDKIALTMKRLFLITKCSFTDIKDLIDFGFIDDEGEYLVARCLIEDGDTFISSDWRITSEGKFDPRLSLLSYPMSLDRVSIWGFDKESLFSFFDLGYSDNDAIRFLSESSRYPISDAIAERIRGYYDQYSEYSMEASIVLTLKGRMKRLFPLIEGIDKYIKRKIDDENYIMDYMYQREWRKLLASSSDGFEKKIKGPEITGERKPLLPFVAEKPFPESRKRSWKGEIKESGEKEKDVISALLKKSGFLISDEEVKGYFPSSDAFDYQGKLKLIEEAEKERDDYALLIEDYKGKSQIGRVDILTKSDDGNDKMIFQHKGMDVGGIYKVTLIPIALL